MTNYRATSGAPQKRVRVKLVDEPTYNEKRQDEINSYFKFKKRQLKTQDQAEKFERQKALIA